MRYRSVPGVREELESLASAEQICCSLVTWGVREDDGQPILRVTSPVGSLDALAPIAALFGASDSTEGSSRTVGS